jgi:signal transduction histidine kinase
VVIQYFDRTVFSGFEVLIVTVMAVLSCKLRFSLPFAIISVLANMTMAYFMNTAVATEELWKHAGTIILPRVFFMLVICIARYNMTLVEKNWLLNQNLSQKTQELEKALDQLRTYTKELKETADLRAREQLLRDLHDKLGHMLVTASIGAQAAAVLIDQDTAAAKERLASVTMQIQGAMQSLRDVLAGKTISYTNNDLLFEQLQCLAKETGTQTGYDISIQGMGAQEYNELPLSHRSIFYNAFMEGLTNGIRHGKATSFICSLSIADRHAQFMLKDNGCGFSELGYGFGLSKIRQNTKKLGGFMAIDGKNGCTLSISLPLTAQEEDFSYATH